MPQARKNQSAQLSSRSIRLLYKNDQMQCKEQHIFKRSFLRLGVVLILAAMASCSSNEPQFDAQYYHIGSDTIYLNESLESVRQKFPDLWCGNDEPYCSFTDSVLLGDQYQKIKTLIDQEGGRVKRLIVVFPTKRQFPIDRLASSLNCPKEAEWSVCKNGTHYIAYKLNMASHQLGLPHEETLHFHAGIGDTPND